MLVAFHRMRLGCTICTEMFGNGVAIAGMIMIAIKALRSMAAFGKLEIANVGSCAAVRGTPIRRAAALPFASGTRRRIATAASVFGLSAFSPGLFSPLLSCSLALCPSSPFAQNHKYRNRSSAGNLARLPNSSQNSDF